MSPPSQGGEWPRAISYKELTLIDALSAPVLCDLVGNGWEEGGEGEEHRKKKRGRERKEGLE